MDSPLDITLCEKKDKNIVFQKFCFILILIVGLTIMKNFIWTVCAADKESVKTHIKINSKVCDPNFPKSNLCPNMYEFLWFSDLWKKWFSCFRIFQTTCSICIAGSTPRTQYHGRYRYTWVGTWHIRGWWPVLTIRRTREDMSPTTNGSASLFSFR